MPNPQFNYYYPYMMQQPQSQFPPSFNQPFNRFPGQMPQQIFHQGPAGFPPNNFERNQGNRVPIRGYRPNQNVFFFRFNLLHFFFSKEDLTIIIIDNPRLKEDTEINKIMVVILRIKIIINKELRKLSFLI